MNKVFGIGIHRTATTSLTIALNVLGIKASHWTHHEEIFKGIKKNNFKFKILEKYDALTDFPIPYIYKELDKEYPKSKFILTVRNTESWWQSLNRHISAPARKEMESLYPEESFFYGINKITDKDKEFVIKKYLNHNREAERYFWDRPNDFLTMNICGKVEKNWEKLCKFLDKDIPDSGFPGPAKGQPHNKINLRNYLDDDQREAM